MYESFWAFSRRHAGWFRLLAVVFLVFVVVRCDKKTDPTPGTFNYVFNKTIKTSNCVECHQPGGAATKDSNTILDFTAQDKAYTTLTAAPGTVKGKTSVGICGTVKIVAAGDPTKSYIMAVLFSDLNKNDFGGVTNCKPDTQHFSLANLTAEEKTSLNDWIKNGAKND